MSMSTIKGFFLGGIFSGLIYCALIIRYLSMKQLKSTANYEFYVPNATLKTAKRKFAKSSIRNPVFCKQHEYCIGKVCDFQCIELESASVIPHLKGQVETREVVDIENSNCVFLHPSSCSDCRCVSRTSMLKDQASKMACEPCQFRRLGWLRFDERKKCAPEVCPLFFPRSCGIGIVSAKHVAELAQGADSGGIWIALIGDSIIRGVFLKAVHFLSARSRPIVAHINHTVYHQNHYVCCNTLRAGNSSEIDGCAAIPSPQTPGPEISPAFLVKDFQRSRPWPSKKQANFRDRRQQRPRATLQAPHPAATSSSSGGENSLCTDVRS